MLKQLFDLAERLLTITRDIRGNQAGIGRLEKQVEMLSGVVRELAFELRRLREDEHHEREKMALQLENTALRFERRLLSGDRSRKLDVSGGSGEKS